MSVAHVDLNCTFLHCTFLAILPAAFLANDLHATCARKQLSSQSKHLEKFKPLQAFVHSKPYLAFQDIWDINPHNNIQWRRADRLHIWRPCTDDLRQS